MSYTWSHSIDDSTDLQSTLTPQDSFFPSAGPFDVAVRSAAPFRFQRSLSDRTSGRWRILQRISERLDSCAADRVRLRSAVQHHYRQWRQLAVVFTDSTSEHHYQPGVRNDCEIEVFSNRCSAGALRRSVCAERRSPMLLQLDGNLGRNAGTTPWTVFNDLRVSKHIPIGERAKLELTADMFNIANRYNVAAVSPLFTNAGQATAAYDPRQLQFGMKVKW